MMAPDTKAYSEVPPASSFLEEPDGSIARNTYGMVIPG